MEKIRDCLFAVIKKYFLKILVYPIILAYGYTFLKYAISNDIDLTYSYVFPYIFGIFFIIMGMEFINKLMSYDECTVGTKIMCEVKPDERTTKIRAYHEAGHFFVAKKLGLPIKEVNIIETENVGGQVLLSMPNILKASQIKNMVMVKYAGFLTEILFNNEASDGCLGYEKSDMDSANIMLRNYIILTDDSLSFTGYEDEHIKNKSIELSKIWKQEVENLLHENRNKIEEIAIELIEKKRLKGENYE
jgi:hypothetical protein